MATKRKVNRSDYFAAYIDIVGLTSKGTIYIVGEYTLDRPKFKFVLEKTDEISPTDVNALLAAYKEANRPNSFITFKKQHIQNTEGKGDLSISSWLSSLPKQKAEAVKKLEETGVTIFFPDKKPNSLSWVIDIIVQHLFTLCSTKGLPSRI